MVDLGAAVAENQTWFIDSAGGDLSFALLRLQRNYSILLLISFKHTVKERRSGGYYIGTSDMIEVFFYCGYINWRYWSCFLPLDCWISFLKARPHSLGDQWLSYNVLQNTSIL